MVNLYLGNLKGDEPLELQSTVFYESISSFNYTYSILNEKFKLRFISMILIYYFDIH